VRYLLDGLVLGVLLVTSDGHVIPMSMSVHCVEMVYSSLLILEQVLWLAVTEAHEGTSLHKPKVTSS
jgi:hypothetical protein